MDDFNAVLQRGSYTMGGKSVVIKKCTRSFNLHDEMMVTPLLVRFPGLPVI